MIISENSRYKVLMILICSFLLLVSCGNRKNRTSNGTSENLDKGVLRGEGVLKDLTGLDGCWLMIYMEDGKKLQPVNWPENATPPMAGSRILIEYVILEDMMSICMAEDHNIDIISFDVIGKSDKPGKKDCVDISDPYSIEWMAELADRLNPYSISRYNYEDGWLYYLQSGTTSYLYDCQGTYICEVPGRAFNDCASMISELEGAKVIWVRNNKE
jgi:hypothetical protein